MRHYLPGPYRWRLSQLEMILVNIAWHLTAILYLESLSALMTMMRSNHRFHLYSVENLFEN